MSSSISSSEIGRPWRRFFLGLLGAALGLGGALYAWIVVVDPFDTLILSPDMDRIPIALNARYSFPALARDPVFDSAVIGTSTSRLLRPARLNPLFGARFANLSMNAATAYEQFRILDLFARHHPAARWVILGADVRWCTEGPDDERYTERVFPEWMYDDDPWNDFAHHFDLYTVEQAGRQFATMLGIRPPKYGRDGYTSFLPDDSAYDPERVRQHLWQGRDPTVRPVEPPEFLTLAERAALDFPSHSLLRQALEALPAGTSKIVYFVPYHISRQPRPGSRDAEVWAECKHRIAEIVADFDHAHVLDFMFPSPITRVDANYWDQIHYTTAVADRVAERLAAAVDDRADHADFRLIRAPGRGTASP
jgi:hypothetical protein